ncbi:hypothetical protein B0T10DRAFT_557855 [Thelonectria olida]|uniref:Uncharacterized protein n=1 Tax=Thelonectria olida TaxID=1576542 RepID=A0A9P8WD48_9HYPO|nr:hypothetical protein B0T10DRAFT_557855 [Thelonectria olida]
MAQCLVYLGKFADARSLLDTAIAEFKKTKPIHWRKSDRGPISRIEENFEASEANFLEALNTGVVCLDQGKTEAAVKHLRDSLVVTKFYKDYMTVEHARTCFKLSEALIQNNPDDTAEADDRREDAEVYLKNRDPDATDFSDKDYYDKFIHIFWR